MFRRIRRKLGRYIPRKWLSALSIFTILVFVLRWTKLIDIQLGKQVADFAFRQVDNPRPRDATRTRIYVSKEHESNTDVKHGHRQHRTQTSKTSISGKEMHSFTEKIKEGNLSIDSDSSQLGYVIVHIWRGLCCPKVNSLRQYPLFPALANQRFLRHTINSGPLGVWYGQRIMGYVHPPQTGNYTFELDAHVFAEMWLSWKQNLKNAELIAKIAKPNLKHSRDEAIGRISKQLYLKEGGKYFFDVLHVMNGGMFSRDHVKVTWKVPGSAEFAEVSSKFLSPLLNDTAGAFLNYEGFKERNDLFRMSPSVVDTEQNDADIGEDDEDYEGIDVPKTKNELSEKFVSHFGTDFDIRRMYNRDNFEHLPETDVDILYALPSCPYEPSYVTKRHLKRYEGVWKTHYSSVFPDDGTSEFICIQNKLKEDCKGNHLLSEHQVLEVVEMATREIGKKISRKLSLKAIVNVERNPDEQRGNRYLLELVFRDEVRNEIVRLSDFVYKFHNSSSLCRPKGITWTRNVTVNVILTVKNQGAWAQHFISEMSRICKETRDDHVNVIIVDYSSQDIDIDKALKRSSLKSYRVLKRSGTFHKTEAIEAAVNTITDPRSIVLLFDLHLLTPKNIFAAVRKHTVEGKIAFTPVLFRLTFCGRPLTSTTQPKGYWETFGFGIFGIYKSDWDRFGGMNVQEFQSRWGGEDWEMIDRVLAAGLEVERLRMPGFYHFYHSKETMWDKSS